MMVNLYDLIVAEECFTDETPPRSIMRLYMRNGLTLQFQDPGRSMIEEINNKLRGYGETGDQIDADY